MINNLNNIKRYDNFITEATKEEYKEFFKDKINWGFLNFIADCCQEYLDGDYYLRFGVVSLVDNSDVKCWIYDYTGDYWTPKIDDMDVITAYYLLHTMNHADKEVKLNVRNNIYYRIISGNIHNVVGERYKEILDNIIERIEKSKKYNTNIIKPIKGYDGIIDIELKN